MSVLARTLPYTTDNNRITEKRTCVLTPVPGKASPGLLRFRYPDATKPRAPAFRCGRRDLDGSELRMAQDEAERRRREASIQRSNLDGAGITGNWLGYPARSVAGLKSQSRRHRHKSSGRLICGKLQNAGQNGPRTTNGQPVPLPATAVVQQHKCDGAFHQTCCACPRKSSDFERRRHGQRRAEINWLYFGHNSPKITALCQKITLKVS